MNGTRVGNKLESRTSVQVKLFRAFPAAQVKPKIRAVQWHQVRVNMHRESVLVAQQQASEGHGAR